MRTSDQATTLGLWGLEFAADQKDSLAPLPLSGEDYLYPFALIPIDASDGDTLEFGEDGDAILLGDAPVAWYPDNREGWVWLDTATPEEMASLRLVYLNRNPEPEQRPLLERLASHNPTLSLATEDSPEIPALPRMVFFYDEVRADVAEALTREEALRTLMMGGTSAPDLRFLKRIPYLETVMLDEWDPGASGPLPDSLPHLKALFLFDPEAQDLAGLGLQPNLEVLMVSCDHSDPPEVSALRRLPSLQRVRFPYCPVEDLSPLDGLHRLRWLGLPPGVTQEQLEHVVDTHPKLEVLELMGSTEVTDLSPLTRLTKLRGLMIGTNAPVEPLLRMDHLDYLAVAVESKETPSYGPDVLPRLRAALPGTAVTTVDVLQFCLGSGFILLLLPALALSWWIIRRRGREGWLASSRSGSRMASGRK